MTLEILERDMKLAWKGGQLFQKGVLANMIDAVKKASMTSKGRIEITEQLVNETLQKYQKTVQEQYDTCPDYSDDPKRDAELKQRKLDYLQELNLVKEYAPQLVTDPEEIKFMIKTIAEADTKMALSKANRGYVMKTLSAQLRGKADMSVVNNVVNQLLV
jgi:uncharacterized protein YqeY